ncbi:mannose-1-phosphate guanylyltransferase [uncultured Bacteroides sp.]|uniref:mannose-1-phosphate guanylyltransferase n=1 Tax=uncultured Bacteroides sp. TaxID=162156 RepID=UPI00263779F3|nr:mannose-1-phosphate guanylyltransferase [uncultured Bacteroides sp.]
MNLNNNHLVIMAGGVGSRFWPMSTVNLPKQFLDVLGCGRTLLQLTADRFKGVCPPENMWVVTSAKYADIVKEQLPELDNQHILLEPCRRNTAPCIAYVSWKIKAKNPKANIVVTPSDHVVMDPREFARVVESAMKFTAYSDAIVTLGMKATRPETGYGYIEADLSMPCPSNKEIYRVDAFKEKPSLDVAKRYLQRKNYFWNSGIFIWNVSTIVNALRVYQPPTAEIFERLLPYYYTEKEQPMIDEMFPMCENISIDYAVMEKAEEIYVFPASFGWSDLGTWSSLHGNTKKDAHENACLGENIKLFETRNCVIHTTEEKCTIVQGLDGYIVAEKNDCLLICRLSEEQRIKEFLGEE